MRLVYIMVVSGNRRAKGKPLVGREKVLFVCGENSARSQMAEAFFNHMAGHWRADSAGTLPASQVKPLAVQAMAEVGIDISAASPKTLDLDNLDEYSRIFSFGCIVNSLFPARERLEELSIEDPGPGDIEEAGQFPYLFFNQTAQRHDIDTAVAELRKVADGYLAAIAGTGHHVSPLVGDIIQRAHPQPCFNI